MYLTEKERKFVFVICCILIFLWCCSCTDNRIRTRPEVPEAPAEHRLAIIKGLIGEWTPQEMAAEFEYLKMKKEE